MTQTRHVWTRDLLTMLGAPGSLENAVAIIAQCQAEGGSARFNPLNCTVKAPGSTDYNSVGVQNFTSYQQGLTVTKGMLEQANMHALLAALRLGTSAPSYWAGLATSPWGTKPPAGYTAASWLEDVRSHWFARAMVPIFGT